MSDCLDWRIARPLDERWARAGHQLQEEQKCPTQQLLQILDWLGLGMSQVVVVLVGEQHWNNWRVDDRQCQRAELTIYKWVYVELQERSLQEWGSHTTSLRTMTFIPVNDSIVFGKVTMSKSSFIALKAAGVCWKYQLCLAMCRNTDDLFSAIFTQDAHLILMQQQVAISS